MSAVLPLPPLAPFVIRDLVRAALLEDFGHGHDITSECVLPQGAQGECVLRAREDGRLAGLDCAILAFEMMESGLRIEPLARDGQDIVAGEFLLRVQGEARALLGAERTALNFLSHLSGIATQTRAFVQAVAGTGTAIVCTRKTLPGLRLFQKYAVRAGGGLNHRFGLDDGILIKDNHIVMAGGVRAALMAAREKAGHMVRIEIEIDTPDQLEAVLACGIADIVLLDNMTLDDLRTCVRLCQNKILTEASGGITLDTVRSVAETGVSMISIGGLTHSVKALDMGLDSVPVG